VREGIDRRAMTLLAAGHLGTDFANGTLPALLALMLLAGGIGTIVAGRRPTAGVAVASCS